MAPTEHEALIPVDETAVATPTPQGKFEFRSKAMELPFINDAVTAATKLHGEATTYPVYNKVEAAIGDIITKAEDTITPHVPAALTDKVLQLDSLACDGLDQVTAKVPALKLPTGELATATTDATFSFFNTVLDILTHLMVVRFFVTGLVYFMEVFIATMRRFQPEESSTPVVGIIYTLLSFIKPLVDKIEVVKGLLEAAVEKNDGKVFGFNVGFPFYRCNVEVEGEAEEKPKEE